MGPSLPGKKTPARRYQSDPVKSNNMENPVRVNIGCGSTPTKGWLNYDAGARWVYNPAYRLITTLFPSFNNKCARANSIRYADAAKGIPLPDSSVGVVYACHIFEHLAPEEGAFFLKEARRLLVPGGIIRLVVPDLQLGIDKYNRDRDGDAFLAGLLFRYTRPRSLWELLKYHYIVGRCHYYMYNNMSIVSRLTDAGFVEARTLSPGQTGIAEPGELDLFERSGDSLYAEAKQPQNACIPNN